MAATPTPLLIDLCMCVFDSLLYCVCLLEKKDPIMISFPPHPQGEEGAPGRKGPPGEQGMKGDVVSVCTRAVYDR